MESGAWLFLVGLGAYHGINPGMGWLFAVALGLQEKNGRAVVRALPPIGIGHALSVALMTGVLAIAQTQISPSLCRWAAGLLLIGFGGYRLVRFRHPTWARMRVGFRQLTVWSFIMASAHGAGLMLFPVFLASESPATKPTLTATDHPSSERSHSESEAGGPSHRVAIRSPVTWLTAVVVHTTAHLIVAGLVAWLVYARLGLVILRRAWLNLDQLWAIALILTGGFVLLSGL